VEHLAKAGIDTSTFPETYVAAALETAREKGKLFKDLAPFVDFYFAADEALSFDPDAKAKALTPAAKQPLEQLRAAFAGTPNFKAATLEAALKQLAAQLGVKVGALVQPCRVACTGKLVGPSLYHLLEVLGREKSLKRMDRAIQLIVA